MLWQVWHQISTDAAFERTEIAIASCCDEPEWAEEVLRLFRIGDDAALAAGTAPTMNELVAYKVSSKLVCIQLLQNGLTLSLSRLPKSV